MIFRVPRGESFVKSSAGVERSKCTSCGHLLNFFDLFPILSWTSLRGRCRYCKNKIGAFYFIVEIFSATVCAAVLYLFGIDFLVFYFFMIYPFFITFVIVFFRYRDLYMVRFLGFIIAGISACALTIQLLFNSYL